MNRRQLAAVVLWGAGMAAVPASAQQADFTFYSPLAEDWYQAAQMFEWTSTTVNNNGQRVQISYRTFGSRSNPALVLLHGYPTSSFDFREMIEFLEDDYFIATLDFPGFGFSDKPQGDYSYMLEDDARLVDHYVREILGLTSFSLFTHDRGVSVGLAFLGNYLANESNEYEVTYHFLSNSGMFLPLANLFAGQTVLLDPVRGPEATARNQARPRRTEGTPVQLAYADIQAFNDGIGARLGVGKYLLERVANEYRWLDNLPKSPIPVAYIWGLLDTVNPVRIANHVWATYLNDRSVESSLWYMPTAGHYPQRDQPEEMAKIVRLALSGEVPSREEEGTFMRSYSRSRSSPASAVFVGHSNIEDMVFPGAVEYTPAGYIIRR
jgi:pimeloyl-ACP methyl ester carboxylesterase